MKLSRIFNPESVAIIGASRDETKRGFRAVSMLIDEKFEGLIFPVNPKEKKVLGLKAYENIKLVPYKVDLALITVPGEKVESVLEDCGEKGVAGAIIVSGGFGEMGRSGKNMELNLLNISKKYGVRLIGPNTSGFINVNEKLDLAGIGNVPKGNIALLSQSGNIALHIITEARLKSQAGFSYYVGVGNEADIKFHEYLEYFTSDESTKVILMYVEGMREGRAFLKQAYATAKKKPIVLLKGGRSKSGKKSVGSHTGALAGISEVAKNAFRRVGIVNIESLEELFPVAEALSKLPLIKNNNVAVLTDGGGHATMAADILTDLGVNISDISSDSIEKLKSVLPANASCMNPVDVAGGADANPEVFAECVEILMKDSNVGGVLVAGLFGGYGIRFTEKLKFAEEDVAHRFGKMVEKYKKPIVVHSLYNFAKPHSLDLLRYYGIPVYDSLDIACRVLSSLSYYGGFLDSYHKKTNFVFNWRNKSRKKALKIIESAYNEGRSVLLEHEAKSILNEHKLIYYEDSFVEKKEEAVSIAEKLGYPVVLKIVSTDILHKSDAGCVKLNIKNREDLGSAYDEIMLNGRNFNPDADIRGCIVSKMIKPDTEVIIGTKVDDQFGPVIMFGIGGILVEVVKDVCFRVLPISRYDAAEMLEELKSSPILDGVRGMPGVDKKSLISLLVGVSEIIESYPEIKEMDLNPVIVHEKGVDVVDARIILNGFKHE